MPSHNKFARAPLWCALSLAFGLAVISPQVDAAGLGRLNVTSGLGQPLRAELEVTSVGRDELPTLQVKMAPLAAFRAANLDFNPALTNCGLRWTNARTAPTSCASVRRSRQRTLPGPDGRADMGDRRVIREYRYSARPPSAAR